MKMWRKLLLMLIAMPLVAPTLQSVEKNRVGYYEKGFSKDGIRYCQPQTPCSWKIYDSTTRGARPIYVVNTYCVCAAGTACRPLLNRRGGGCIEHRCRH